MSKSKKQNGPKPGVVGVKNAPALTLEEQELVTATVSAPLVRTKGFVSRRVDVHLSRHAAQTLRDLRDGLSQMGYTLKSGKVVDTNNAALLWLLENFQVDKVK